MKFNTIPETVEAVRDGKLVVVVTLVEKMRAISLWPPRR